MPKIFGKEISGQTLGLLGAGLGGILGAGGSKGETSGSQGYAGGIPDYTATRNLAPNAFASTMTDPITQEVRARRPGEAGRQYFTDTLGQSRVNFTRGADNAILGQAELDALNKANIAQQKIYDDAGKELLGIASLNQQEQAGVNAGVGTGIAAGTGTGVAPAAGVGTGIAAGTGVAPAAGTGVAPAAGAAGAGAGAGTGVVAGTGVEVDPNAAFASFMSPFYNQEQLTPAQLIQLGSSDYDLTTIASMLEVDPIALSNAIAAATAGAGTKGVVGAGAAGTDLTGGAAGDAVDNLLTANELASVASGKYTDNGDGTFSDARGNIFNEVDGKMTVDQFYTGQELIDQDTAAKKDALNAFALPFLNQDQLTPAQLIALGNSNFDLAALASTLEVDQTALSGAIAGAQDNAQTQGILDAVDPSDGFSDTEAASVANLILDGKTDINDVSKRFTDDVEGGMSDMDVIEAMVRGGFETPADMAKRLAADNTGLTEIELMAGLLRQGRTTPEELAAYYGNNPKYPDYAGVTAADVRGFAKDLGIKGYAAGGDINGYYLGGTTDGMADNVPATIDNMQPAALSDGEFVIPADVVSHLGNGNSDSGAKNLYSMMERVRTDRTGNPNQGNQINPNQYLA